MTHLKWLLFSGCSVGGGMYGIVLGLGYTAFGDQAFVVSGCRFSANGVTDIVLYGATQTLISNSIFLSRGSGPAHADVRAGGELGGPGVRHVAGSQSGCAATWSSGSNASARLDIP